MFPWSEPTARQSETKHPANSQKPANRRRCTLKSRRTESAVQRNRDEPSALRAKITTNRTTYPLETRGTKKYYLSKLNSLHLQPACPTSWWEKPAHATRKNQKSKQASANLPYLPTRCEARTGLGGRKKFSEPKRRTFHAGERTMNGQQPRKARQITSEKFLLAAWAVRNFSPLLSRTKSTIFVSFTVFSQRKLLGSIGGLPPIDDFHVDLISVALDLPRRCG